MPLAGIHRWMGRMDSRLTPFGNDKVGFRIGTKCEISVPYIELFRFQNLQEDTFSTESLMKFAVRIENPKSWQVGLKHLPFPFEFPKETERAKDNHIRNVQNGAP